MHADKAKYKTSLELFNERLGINLNIRNKKQTYWRWLKIFKINVRFKEIFKCKRTYAFELGLRKGSWIYYQLRW